MFAYRERRLRALVIAGAAEVQVLTAGKSKFKADLAMNAVVGFETVPLAPNFFEARNEDRRDAGLTQHRRCTAGTLPLLGFPTARLPERGLRDSQA
jgi:hypothetical protein